MARWSPTVAPRPVSPFWDSFNAELGRSLADSPAQNIAYQRNQMAREELDRRNRRDEEERPLRLEQSGYAPVPTWTMGPSAIPGLTGTRIPLVEGGAPTTGVGNDVWQYAPGKALERRDALDQQAELRGVRTRLRGAGEVERAINEEQGTDRPLSFGVDVEGRSLDNDPSPFAYRMSARDKVSYGLTGRLPGQSSRGGSSGTTRLIQQDDGTYLWADPNSRSFEQAEFEGGPVRGKMPSGPARTEADRIAYEDNQFFAKRYAEYLKPDKWGVKLSPEAATEKAQQDVAIRQRQRRAQRLGAGLDEE